MKIIEAYDSKIYGSIGGIVFESEASKRIIRLKNKLKSIERTYYISLPRMRFFSTYEVLRSMPSIRIKNFYVSFIDSEGRNIPVILPNFDCFGEMCFGHIAKVIHNSSATTTMNELYSRFISSAFDVSGVMIHSYLNYMGYDTNLNAYDNFNAIDKMFNEWQLNLDFSFFKSKSLDGFIKFLNSYGIYAGQIPYNLENDDPEYDWARFLYRKYIDFKPLHL